MYSFLCLFCLAFLFSSTNSMFFSIFRFGHEAGRCGLFPLDLFPRFRFLSRKSIPLFIGLPYRSWSKSSAAFWSDLSSPTKSPVTSNAQPSSFVSMKGLSLVFSWMSIKSIFVKALTACLLVFCNNSTFAVYPFATDYWHWGTSVNVRMMGQLT